MRQLGVTLVLAGAASMLAAFGWWWLTYRDVIAYDYIAAREAGYCLIGETDICALARALCRGSHPLATSAYSSASLWVGFALLCLGLMLDGWRRPEGEDDRTIVPQDFWF